MSCKQPNNIIKHVCDVFLPGKLVPNPENGVGILYLKLWSRETTFKTPIELLDPMAAPCLNLAAQPPLPHCCPDVSLTMGKA